MRQLLTVIVPWLVWGALENGIYMGLSSAAPGTFPTAGPMVAVGPLVFLLILRAGYSYVAGNVAGRIGRAHPGAVRLAIALLFVTGVAVQAGTWSAYPVWYHLIFLASIIPAAGLGARHATGNGNA